MSESVTLAMWTTLPLSNLTRDWDSSTPRESVEKVCQVTGFARMASGDVNFPQKTLKASMTKTTATPVTRMTI